jgi:hypothetical protein
VIVAQETYLLICALLTAVVAAYWICVDTYRLRVALRQDRSLPVTRDKLFGSTIGILVGIAGVFGILKYYYL